ncbi:hypothetical protein D0B42_24510, partial [Salmonella enterica]|nr:hypothetical protein [Salmonella enterica]
MVTLAISMVLTPINFLFNSTGVSGIVIFTTQEGDVSGAGKIINIGFYSMYNFYDIFFVWFSIICF